jgi:hypothetical protein
MIAMALVLLSSVAFAQEKQPAPPADSAQVQVEDQGSNITIPAGTHLAMVLTQPVQTRYIRRGDDIYAQVTSPVNAENQVVIPPGTFVQGMVDKIERHGGRGQVRLQSMSITFPDGYVTPISGPIVLDTTDGYAIKDPGSKRGSGAILLPLAGIGLGALIGHSVGKADSTVTSNFPPGCNPPEFLCITTTNPVMGTKGKDAAIGASIGGAAGMIGSIFVLMGSRHFYLDAGAPVQMTLQQPVTLPQNEVAKAVRDSQEHAVVIQPVEPRPLLPPPSSADHGTCYTPGTPGTPPTMIPGTPGPDGIPGPPTVIPGTPATPGTAYPCP